MDKKYVGMHHDTVLLNPPHLQGTLVTGRIFLFPVLRPPEACRGLQGHSWIPTALSPQLQHCVKPTVQRWSRGQLFCWSDSQTQAKLAWLRSSLGSISTAFTRFQSHLEAIKHTPLPKCVFLSHPPRVCCAELSKCGSSMTSASLTLYLPESCCLGISHDLHSFQLKTTCVKT